MYAKYNFRYMDCIERQVLLCSFVKNLFVLSVCAGFHELHVAHMGIHLLGETDIFVGAFWKSLLCLTAVNFFVFNFPSRVFMGLHPYASGFSFC